MKRIITVAIALASINAFAQTETAAPAAAPAATTATAPVKKVKAAKKVAKKASKPKAMNATAEAVKVAEATPATAPVVAGTDVPSPAAGTSTATVTAPAATPKKVSGSVSTFSTADYLAPRDVQTLTSIGVSYKPMDKLSLKVKQTFETLTAGPVLSENAEDKQKIEDNNFRPTYADFTVGTTLPAVMGSGAVAASLNYKLISGDAIYSTTGGYSTAYGMWEANLSVPYSITPKVDLSIDSQWRHVISTNGPSANSNRFLVIPTASYTISDLFSVYQSAGLIWSLRDNNELRQRYQRLYLETGVTMTPAKGFSVTLAMEQDHAIAVRAGEADRVSTLDIYNPTQATDGATFDAVAYDMSLAYTF